MSTQTEDINGLVKARNINDLPLEIFTSILLSIPDRYAERRSTHAFRPATPAMLLTCKKWNTVTCRTPAFWTALRLDDSPWCLDLARLSLDRSGGCKLHIVAERAEDLLQKYGDLMREHFHRIESLVFSEEHKVPAMEMSDQPPVDFPFITSCIGLRRLTLLAHDDLVRRSTTNLELPVLHTLVIEGHVNILGKRFSSLPELIHLTIFGGGVNYEDKQIFVMWQKTMTLTSTWPVMPKLRTLTVDLEDVADLIPTIETSPLLLGIHIHGHWGFRRLLDYLLEPHRRERAPVPHLERLRIWPEYLGDVEVQNVETADPPYHIWSPLEKPGIDILPQILDIIEWRPDLLVDIGVTDVESLNNWNRGDLGDLRSPWCSQYVPEDFGTVAENDVRDQVFLDEIFKGDVMRPRQAELGWPALPDIYCNL